MFLAGSETCRVSFRDDLSSLKTPTKLNGWAASRPNASNSRLPDIRYHWVAGLDYNPWGLKCSHGGPQTWGSETRGTHSVKASCARITQTVQKTKRFRTFLCFCFLICVIKLVWFDVSKAAAFHLFVLFFFKILSLDKRANQSWARSGFCKWTYRDESINSLLETIISLLASFIKTWTRITEATHVHISTVSTI